MNNSSNNNPFFPQKALIIFPSVASLLLPIFQLINYIICASSGSHLSICQKNLASILESSIISASIIILNIIIYCFSKNIYLPLYYRNSKYLVKLIFQIIAIIAIFAAAIAIHIYTLAEHEPHMLYLPIIIIELILLISQIILAKPHLNPSTPQPNTTTTPQVQSPSPQTPQPTNNSKTARKILCGLNIILFIPAFIMLGAASDNGIGKSLAFIVMTPIGIILGSSNIAAYFLASNYYNYQSRYSVKTALSISILIIAILVTLAFSIFTPTLLIVLLLGIILPLIIQLKLAKSSRI